MVELGVTTTEVRGLMEASRPHFIAREWGLSGTCSPSIIRELSSRRARIGPCISALMQLDSAFDDCACPLSLMRKLRFGKSSPKYSTRLRLYWTAFLNACYTYSEKVKLVTKQCELAKRDFGNAEIVGSFSDLRKRTIKLLHPYIRERGEVVHEWHRDHQGIFVLGMVEILGVDKDSRYHDDIHGHFDDAKHRILQDVKIGFEKLQILHIPILRDIAVELTSAASNFNKDVEKSKSDGLIVTIK